MSLDSSQFMETASTEFETGAKPASERGEADSGQIEESSDAERLERDAKSFKSSFIVVLQKALAGSEEKPEVSYKEAAHLFYWINKIKALPEVSELRALTPSLSANGQDDIINACLFEEIASRVDASEPIDHAEFEAEKFRSAVQTSLEKQLSAGHEKVSQGQLMERARDPHYLLMRARKFQTSKEVANLRSLYAPSLSENMQNDIVSGCVIETWDRIIHSLPFSAPIEVLQDPEKQREVDEMLQRASNGEPPKTPYLKREGQTASDFLLETYGHLLSPNDLSQNYLFQNQLAKIHPNKKKMDKLKPGLSAQYGSDLWGLDLLKALQHQYHKEGKKVGSMSNRLIPSKDLENDKFIGLMGADALKRQAKGRSRVTTKKKSL